MSATAKHFIDDDGKYLGAFDGYVDAAGEFVPPIYPAASVEMPGPPPSGDGRQKGDPATAEWIDFAPPVGDLPLNRFQFEALVIAMGLSMAGLEAAIDALPISAFEKAVAISRLRNAVTYNRDHPLVEQVRLQIGLTVEDLDAAWLQAAALN